MMPKPGRGHQTDTAVEADGIETAEPRSPDEPRGRTKQKSEWARRLDLLESVDFKSVAAEINRKRWERLQTRLEESSEVDRKKMPGLFREFKAGKLTELPSHLRANPRRMKATLVAIHRRFGRYAGKGVIEIGRLASDAGQTPATTKRSISDLCEGQLLDADRKRQRAGDWKRRGGQGPSWYRIPYSSIADRAINSAQTGGFQWLFSLPEDSEDQFDDATRPCSPRSTSRFETAFRSSEQSAPAPAQSAPALAHSALAPAHNTVANARAGASHPEFLSVSLHASPSPSRPANNLSCDTPSADAAEICRVESQGEKQGGQSQNWNDAIQRLQDFGLTQATRAIEAARRNGWSVAQVLTLLDECQAAHAIGPGKVFRHLQLSDPGTMIATPLRKSDQREWDRFAPITSFVRDGGSFCHQPPRAQPPDYSADHEGQKKRDAMRDSIDALKQFAPALDAMKAKETAELIQEIAERKGVDRRFCGNRISLLEGLAFRASQKERDK